MLFEISGRAGTNSPGRAVPQGNVPARHVSVSSKPHSPGSVAPGIAVPQQSITGHRVHSKAVTGWPPREKMAASMHPAKGAPTPPLNPAGNVKGASVRNPAGIAAGRNFTGITTKQRMPAAPAAYRNPSGQPVKANAVTGWPSRQPVSKTYMFRDNSFTTRPAAFAVNNIRTYVRSPLNAAPAIKYRTLPSNRRMYNSRPINDISGTPVPTKINGVPGIGRPLRLPPEVPVKGNNPGYTNIPGYSRQVLPNRYPGGRAPHIPDGGTKPNYFPRNPYKTPCECPQCGSNINECTTLSHFALGSVELTQAHRLQISRLAKDIVQRNINVVSITGHTDATGSDENNLVLGNNRSAAVRKELKTAIHNIRPWAQTTIFFKTNTKGESQPLSHTDPAMNRRVEVCLQQMEF